MEQWRFLYTDFSDIKKAVTKTGALKEGKLSRSHYIVTEGKDYSTCKMKAQNETGFKDKQLLGARRIK
jgi:hypothetical protein